MSELSVYGLTSAVLISSGVYVIVAGKHALRALLGILLMLNGALLLFVAFSQFFHRDSSGTAAAFIIMIVIVIEALAGVSIIVRNTYRGLSVSTNNARGQERN